MIPSWLQKVKGGWIVRVLVTNVCDRCQTPSFAIELHSAWGCSPLEGLGRIERAPPGPLGAGIISGGVKAGLASSLQLKSLVLALVLITGWILLTCLSDFSFFCSKLRFRSLDSANASWKSEKKKLLGRIEVLWPLHFEEVGSSTIMMLKRWRDWTCKRVGDL